jgi:hypothetical protein
MAKQLVGKAVDQYKKKHWGLSAKKVVRVAKQAGMGRGRLTEMGELFALILREHGDLNFPARRRPRKNMVAFDSTKASRLYLILNPATRKACKRLIHPDCLWYSFREVADAVGGRQADHETRKGKIQAIGRVIHIHYRTEKRGDGISVYDHRLGEEGGIEPMLCVDRTGQLYLVGGTHRTLDGGIAR